MIVMRPRLAASQPPQTKNQYTTTKVQGTRAKVEYVVKCIHNGTSVMVKAASHIPADAITQAKAKWPSLAGNAQAWVVYKADSYEACHTEIAPGQTAHQVQLVKDDRRAKLGYML